MRAPPSRAPCTSASGAGTLELADAIDAALGSAFDVASVDLPLTPKTGEVVELKRRSR
jgi:hypothetical protein